MNFRLKFFAMIILAAALTFTACYGGGGSGGETETPASTLFANKTYIAAGAQCAAGGVQIDMGFDNNKNNKLDADEITKTEYVCNGEDASSHPFVVYTSPAPNETDVELDTVISAVFNTEMDGSTITDTTFTVKDSNGNSVAGTVSYSGIVAVFTPAEPLSINKKYTVSLASSIENDNDIAMDYNHKIYFTSGKAAVIYKANGATGGTVPVNANRYGTGESVTASANTGSLYKTGYSFCGWNTKADGTGTSKSEGSTITIANSSVILYAVWVIVPVSGVMVNNSMIIEKGFSMELTPTVTPSNATNHEVTWLSSVTTVATVSSDGLVTAVNEGTTIITVKTVDGTFTDTSIVTVSPAITSGLGAADRAVLLFMKNHAEWASAIGTWTSANTDTCGVNSSMVQSKIVDGVCRITKIDVPGLSITSLPDEIGNLTELNYLSVVNNSLTNVPEFTVFNKLNYLYLADNSIISFPNSINRLTNLLDYSR